MPWLKRAAETKDWGHKLGRNALAAFRELLLALAFRSFISFSHFKAAAEQPGTMRLSPLWAAKNQHRIMATTKSQLACADWQVVQVQRTSKHPSHLPPDYYFNNYLANGEFWAVEHSKRTRWKSRNARRGSMTRNSGLHNEAYKCFYGGSWGAPSQLTTIWHVHHLLKSCEVSCTCGKLAF